MTVTAFRFNHSNDLEALHQFLGGAPVLGRDLGSGFELHDLLVEGLPAEALAFLEKQLTVLKRSDLVGKSRAPRSGRLQAHLGEQVVRSALVLIRATDVFGSLSDAEDWLRSPALGLDGRVPLDLIATEVGTQLVQDHLIRIDYGVYI